MFKANKISTQNPSDMKSTPTLILSATFSLFCLTNIFAQAVPEISTEVYLSGFSAPVGIVNSGPNDTDRLFIVEKGGDIEIIENGVKLATPFLDISDQIVTNGEKRFAGFGFSS